MHPPYSQQGVRMRRATLFCSEVLQGPWGLLFAVERKRVLDRFHAGVGVWVRPSYVGHFFAVHGKIVIVWRSFELTVGSMRRLLHVLHFAVIHGDIVDGWMGRFQNSKSVCAICYGHSVEHNLQPCFLAFQSRWPGIVPNRFLSSPYRLPLHAHVSPENCLRLPDNPTTRSNPSKTQHNNAKERGKDLLQPSCRIPHRTVLPSWTRLSCSKMEKRWGIRKTISVCPSLATKAMKRNFGNGCWGNAGFVHKHIMGYLPGEFLSKVLRDWR
mmetsp:Transcript_6973/g.30528  ORF Transcript_6973/g.30528 Transcript_6973/m.30528 type:complete len:269 (+) Transcript_6973:2530-3336(+)